MGLGLVAGLKLRARPEVRLEALGWDLEVWESEWEE